MRTEAKSPELSLYCKQSTIESWHELPWACGYSSIVTAMRLLGDRKVRANRFPQRLARLGWNPKDGIDDDQLRGLLRDDGYSVRSYPASSSHDDVEFVRWLRGAWARHCPTIVACGGYRESVNDHYVVAYSDPSQAEVWVMDPGETSEVFSRMSWTSFIRWASDGSSGTQNWEGHSVSSKQRSPLALPPSSELFQWINELPGKFSEKDYVAVAFVDNLLETISEFQARKDGPAVPFLNVVAADGRLWEKLQLWGHYFDEEDFGILGNMLRVAFHLDVYLERRIDASRLEAFTSEIALLCVNVLRFHGWREKA